MMNIEIVELSKRNDLLDKAIDYFWNCWGNENNYNFYNDCISNSLDEKSILPKFYLVLYNDEIIGSYALVTNDIISRQDLFPWFACLYVNNEHRNKGIAGQLLKHGLNEAKKKGYKILYLSTDLEGFYERYGWIYIADGFNFAGIKTKIYSKSTL
ncbi:MAG: GNAT family N-acetyltransferase [Bacteroidales bacterium]|nr:GNAT family N-acetyltransferase [Bacteroidales bacterium]